MGVLLDPNFWVLISFLIFVALAWVPLKAKLQAVLQERQERIRRQLEEAEAILLEAKRIEKQAVQHLDQVERQVQEIWDLAQQESAHLQHNLEKEKKLLWASHARLLEQHRSMLLATFRQELRKELIQHASHDALQRLKDRSPGLDPAYLRQVFTSTSPAGR